MLQFPAKGNISWKNLDPGKVVKEVSSLLDLGLIEVKEEDWTQ